MTKDEFVQLEELRKEIGRLLEDYTGLYLKTCNLKLVTCNLKGWPCLQEDFF
jgi:hypothetical protein